MLNIKTRTIKKYNKNFNGKILIIIAIVMIICCSLFACDKEVDYIELEDNENIVVNDIEFKNSEKIDKSLTTDEEVYYSATQTNINTLKLKQQSNLSGYYIKYTEKTTIKYKETNDYLYINKNINTIFKTNDEYCSFILKIKFNSTRDYEYYSLYTEEDIDINKLITVEIYNNSYNSTYTDFYIYPLEYNKTIDYSYSAIYNNYSKTKSSN